MIGARPLVCGAAALLGACGLDAVELVPEPAGEVWLVDVEADSAARFASAREKAVPEGELALRSPVSEAVWPDNAALEVAWFDKRPTGPKDAGTGRPCELTLRAGGRQLRIYAQGPFTLPAARLRELVRASESRQITGAFSCARDPEVREISVEQAFSFTLGPSLLAEGLAVWSDGAVFVAPLAGVAAPAGAGVTSRYGFAVGGACAALALTAEKGELALPIGWTPPAESLDMVGAIAASPDGRELAVVTADRVRVLDTATGAVRGERAIPELSPAAPVFGDDGALYVAVASAGAPKPAMAGASIASLQREPGGALAAAVVLAGAASADGPVVPGFWWGGALWGTSALGKLDDLKDGRLVRFQRALPEPVLPPLDKVSDSDPSLAPSGDVALAYVLFTSTRPRTAEAPAPEQTSLWLSACTPDGACAAPLPWPLDPGVPTPRRALFCGVP